MDADGLLLSLELASGSGQGLSPDRRASLLTSLRLVARDYRFARVLFWGRVLGVAADYFVAQGLAADQLAPRKTLYRSVARAGPEGPGGRGRGPGSQGAGPRRFRGRDWASERSGAGPWRARGRDWASGAGAGPGRWGRSSDVSVDVIGPPRRLGGTLPLGAGPCGRGRDPGPGGGGAGPLGARAGRGRGGCGRGLDVRGDVIGPPPLLGGVGPVGGGTLAFPWT